MPASSDSTSESIHSTSCNRCKLVIVVKCPVIKCLSRASVVINSYESSMKTPIEAPMKTPIEDPMKTPIEDLIWRLI